VTAVINQTPAYEITSIENGMLKIRFDPDECLSDWTAIKSAIVLSAVLNPGSAHDFTLCSDTVFLLESLTSDQSQLQPIDIKVDNAVFRCGNDGEIDNNCLIVGGYAHFRMIESIKDVSFVGITFSGASLSSILATGEADASVEFVNCAWIGNSGVAAILIYNEDKGVPITASTTIEELVEPRAKSMTVSCIGCVFSRNDLYNSTVVNLGGTAELTKSVFIANKVWGGVIINKFGSNLVMDGSCFFKNDAQLAGTIVVEENSVVELNKDTYGELNTIGHGTCEEVFYEVGDSCIGGANPKCVGLCGYFTADTCQVDIESISSLSDLIDDLFHDKVQVDLGDSNIGGVDGDGNFFSELPLGVFIGVGTGILIIGLCCMGCSYRFGQKSVLAQYAAVPVRDDHDQHRPPHHPDHSGNRPCAIATPARPAQPEIFLDNLPVTAVANESQPNIATDNSCNVAQAEVQKDSKPSVEAKPEPIQNQKEKQEDELPTFHRKPRRVSNSSDAAAFSLFGNRNSAMNNDDDDSALGVLASKTKTVKKDDIDDAKKPAKKDEEKQKKDDSDDSSESDEDKDLESKKKTRKKNHNRKSRKDDETAAKDKEPTRAAPKAEEERDRKKKQTDKKDDKKTSDDKKSLRESKKKHSSETNKRDSLRSSHRLKKEPSQRIKKGDKESSDQAAEKKSLRDSKRSSNASETDKHRIKKDESLRDSKRSSNASDTDKYRIKKDESLRDSKRSSNASDTDKHRIKKDAKETPNPANDKKVLRDSTRTSGDTGDQRSKETTAPSKSNDKKKRSEVADNDNDGEKKVLRDSSSSSDDQSEDVSQYSTDIDNSAKSSISLALSSRRSSVDLTSRNSSSVSLASLDSSRHSFRAGKTHSRRRSMDSDVSEASSVNVAKKKSIDIKSVERRRRASIEFLSSAYNDKTASSKRGSMDSSVHSDSMQKQSTPQRSKDDGKKSKRESESHRDTSKKRTKERSITPTKSRRSRDHSEPGKETKDKSPSRSKRSSTEKKRDTSTSPSRKESSKKDTRSRDRSESPHKERRKNKGSKDRPESSSKRSSTERKREPKARGNLERRKSELSLSTEDKKKARGNLERRKSELSFKSTEDKKKARENLERRKSELSLLSTEDKKKARGNLERRKSELSVTAEVKEKTMEKGSRMGSLTTKEKLLKDMAKLDTAIAGQRGIAAQRTKHHMVHGHKPLNTSALKPFDLKDLKASTKSKIDE